MSTIDKVRILAWNQGQGFLCGGLHGYLESCYALPRSGPIPGSLQQAALCTHHAHDLTPCVCADAYQGYQELQP